MTSRAIALVLLLFFSPLIIVIYFLIAIIDGYPSFFIQKRIGKNNTIFNVYKFRTMKLNLGDIPTHLMDKPDSQLSNLGPLLRKFSIDEIPQLVNIIKGDMLFVGPRPALYNQIDLISLRTNKGIDSIKPGVTGWAQVNGRDELTINEKVALDEFYLKNKSIFLDIKIILSTIKQLIFPKGVSH